MAVEGTMARRIADVRAALQVIAGHDRRDPMSLPVTLTALDDDQRLRIAVLAEPPGGATHPEIAAAVRSAADVLADAGHHVVEATPPMYEESIEMWAGLLAQDLVVTKPMLDLLMGADAQALVASLLDRTPEPTVESIALLQMERTRAMRRWSEFFAEYPVLLSPTWAMP